MATNFGEIVAEVQGYLRSFVRDQELSTHLIANIDATDTSIRVADGSVISRGRIEIDDELIWVDSSARQTGIVSVPPYGRGMDATTPAAHSAGTRVIVTPLYPRKLLKDTINQTIRQIGSQLYGVEDITLTLKTYRDFKYELPSYVRDVLTVKVSDERWYGDVTYLRDWTFDKNAPLEVSTTGRAIYLYDQEWVGSNIKLTVTVTRDPKTLTADTDLWTDTYLPETAADLPVLGAASRLLATSDAFDIQSRSVEANTLATGGQGSGAAAQQSKYLVALFAQRLDEERLRLLNSHATRSRYQR